MTTRPSDPAVRRFRSLGVWRDRGPITELRRWRDETPDAPAIKAYRADGESALIGYAEYARRDRIGGVFMIPVIDVESELLTNPGVEDVALVGYPDGQGGELACAVVVPATEPPVTLDELRTYLTDKGMTEWYLPSRLEYVESLPRNDNGKVRKELLRSRLGRLVGPADVDA